MAIRWIQDGEPHVAEVYNRPLRDFVLEAEAKYIPSTRKITATNGVTGGGMLTGDVEISGVAATTTTVGVSRFATLAEVQQGTAQNVGISPNILSQIPMGLGSAGQQWVDLWHDRQVNTTYYNTTGKPIVVLVMAGMDYDRVNDAIEVWCIINGMRIPMFGDTSAPIHGKQHSSGSIIVPIGASYRLEYSSRTMAQPRFRHWFELR